MKPYAIDKALLEWATPTQARYLEAVLEHGSSRKAAKALGAHRTLVQDAIRRLRKAAALQGYSPEHDMTRPVPDGFIAGGVSTYYNKDGKPTGQWVKARADDARMEELRRAAWQAMADELPRTARTTLRSSTNADLCNVYTMTDCHMGMLAWHKEGGHDWDVAIAERVLSGCFEHMVRAAPPAAVAVVAQLGDFLHSDGLAPVTPTGGNILDQDGRFSKIVQASIRVLRRMVQVALTKHEKVVVLMAEGNHDLASSVWLRAMFRALYENEPRVEVIDSELPFYTYQHGKTMLAWHHGHLKQTSTLPLLFAAQFPQMWGVTTKRYCHTGHRHHTDEKEHNGMTVHQHPTLAARDAYASRHGWMAERQVTGITYHREFGQVARNTVTPEMLEAF